MKNISREVKIVQKNQKKITEMKYTIKEKEPFLEGFNSTGGIIQDTVIDLEDIQMEFTQSDQQKIKDWGKKMNRALRAYKK